MSIALCGLVGRQQAQQNAPSSMAHLFAIAAVIWKIQTVPLPAEMRYREEGGGLETVDRRSRP